MAKAPDAFRTISEVADWLETPAHVLRFWESKFREIAPVKRAGGRRYYRPADMALLGGIKKLLHDDGMTIKGVQKLLREQGVAHVSTFAPPINDQPVSNVVDLRPARPAPARTSPAKDPGDDAATAGPRLLATLVLHEHRLGAAAIRKLKPLAEQLAAIHGQK